jgi:subtilase family serine protease
LARLSHSLARALAAAALCGLTQYAAAQRAIHEPPPATLYGTVHPLARAEFDRGTVAPDLRLDRMLLLLTPSAAQQSALDALVAAQHDPHSPEFHHWLTPAQYASRFGAASGDAAQVNAWLAQHGFTIDEFPAGNRLIVFSGTAAQIADAFHTELHRYRIGNTSHIANSQDPQIPAALAPVVAGIVSLHDFRRASAIAQHRPLDAKAQWTLGGSHYIYPVDFAALYDLNPLYAVGTTGSGATIAIAARSNINLADVAAFRLSAGLAANDPAVILAGPDPGLVENDQDESTLDVEWSGAVAPAASVALVAAGSTAVTDGIDLSAQYIVNHALAPVVSVSYASCEQQMGAIELAFYNSLWEQAASQGMSVLVASGDAGAAGCNQGSDSTGSVAAVNGLCSSPYSTCVGGTEFNEGANPGQYWATANSAAQGSALGYIPESVWNESASNSGYGLWSSGGGISQVYAQPAWQQAASGAAAANGMRAVPDVSLTAASHDGYVIYENGFDWIVSGTSVAAPAMAAIMALAVQANAGQPQGNANAILYPLAAIQPSAFHRTPEGNNTVPGVEGFAAASQTYNLATGLGSADASSLVNGWSAAADPPTLSIVASEEIVVAQGGSSSVAVGITVAGSFDGDVTLSVAGLPVGVSAVWSTNPIALQDGAGAATLTLSASRLSSTTSAAIFIQASGVGLTTSQQIWVAVEPPRPWLRPRPMPIFPAPRTLLFPGSAQTRAKYCERLLASVNHRVLAERLADLQHKCRRLRQRL